MHILEIGAGLYPWFVRQDHFSVNSSESTPLKQEFAKIGEENTYICVDHSYSQVQKGSLFVRNNCRDLVQGVFLYVQADALRLPFTDESFDVVVLSDVFSLPEMDWHDAQYGLQRGCTRESKLTIIKEVKRVLRSGGRFIECAYQGFSSLTWSDHELGCDENLVITFVCMRNTIVIPHTTTQQLTAREIVYTKK